jgi:anti-anti-sigma factor
MAETTKTNVTEIQCAESLDISMAAALHQTLKKALESGAPITLQVHKVERADTAALQVLAAFMRAARARGITVSWNAPSASLRRSAQLLGLAQELEIPPQD